MSDREITEYAKSFASLRSDKNRNTFPNLTYNRAPHKPLLLLSVLDLFEQGLIRSNLIELTPDLGDLFTRYWSGVMTPDRQGNLVLPFFHLRSDGFWHLVARQGKEEILSSVAQIRSLLQLRDTIVGARLDEELYRLLQAPEARATLRAVLAETYFTPELSSVLLEQSTVNRGALRYSETLLRKDYEKVAEALIEEEQHRPAVRYQGFRRAIVNAYGHRCALCGIRVMTVDGHTAVEASHIVPWSLSYDDRPANGMSLCRLCHWSFDEGLLRVSTSYEVAVSPQLTALDNLPGYMTSLQGRSIFHPIEEIYCPDPDSLKWHHRNVFRAG